MNYNLDDIHALMDKMKKDVDDAYVKVEQACESVTDVASVILDNLPTNSNLDALINLHNSEVIMHKAYTEYMLKSQNYGLVLDIASNWIEDLRKALKANETPEKM